jgi:hypothetical protein
MRTTSGLSSVMSLRRCPPPPEALFSCYNRFMDFEGNRAILTEKEAKKCSLPTPYIIGDETIGLLRDTEERARILSAQVIELPLSAQQNALKSELRSTQEKADIFRQMVRHYLSRDVSLDDKISGFGR